MLTQTFQLLHVMVIHICAGSVHWTESRLQLAAGWVSWVPATGQDAVADHASPDIDFIAFHSWIDNWQPGVSHLALHRQLLALEAYCTHVVS